MVRFCIILCLLATLIQLSSGQQLSKGCGDPGAPKHGYRVGDNFSFKSSVRYFCDRGFKLARGSRLRKCQENGKWNGYVPKCTATDVDECKKYDMRVGDARDELNDVQRRDPGYLCHEKATCVNTIGSFKCECIPGYHGNGKICLPTNFNEEELLLKSKRRSRLHACGTITTNNTARTRRIVGGRTANHGAWPWQAAILYKNYGRRFLFNGAFIKPRWVLTVASALKRGGILVKPNKLQVALGEHNREKLDGTERYVRVKRMVIHPKYNRHTLSNNIALLELAKPVKPTSHIRTVCLPRKKRDARLEQPPFSGYVAGWGSSKKLRLGESTGPLSPTLKQVEAPLVPNKVCKRSSIYTYDQSNYFCAGYRKKAKAPCFSDVGSPMVVQSPKTGRWVVLGLFGWSEGCGQSNKYAYYTRVTRYRRWILSVLHRVH